MGARGGDLRRQWEQEATHPVADAGFAKVLPFPIGDAKGHVLVIDADRHIQTSLGARWHPRPARHLTIDDGVNSPIDIQGIAHPHDANIPS